MRGHHKNPLGKYFLKSFCFLVILLAITIATIFVTINPVTALVHKLEEHYPMQVSDIELNDYEIEVGMITADEADYDYGDRIATITSHDFALNAPVYYGANRTCVLAGAGLHSKSSGGIGLGGTSLIVGFEEGEFSPLIYAEVGDTVTVATGYGRYNYQISEVSYSSNSKDDYLDLGEDKLVLCALTSEFSAHTGESLYVIADLVGEVQ